MTGSTNPFGTLTASSDIPRGAPISRHHGSSSGYLSAAKEALFRYFEAILVLALLASLLFINSFVVHKYAFLLLYFIPVLLAGFHLGARQAVTTALLTTGLVVYIVLVDPFGVQTESETFNFWNLLIWACFLTLTGALVGQLQEKNQVQVRQLREAYLGVIQILTKYLESADAETKGHSERVAAVSVAIGNRLGLIAAAVENIWTAALLHDVGKVEVVELIQKATSLTPAEKKEVDVHTQLGAQLLQTTGVVLKDAVPLVLEHHRHYNDGGESIPLGARIIAVADAYDAIVCDRPYRAGRLHWQAVEILEQGAGEQFDPAVVTALKSIESQVRSVYEGPDISAEMVMRGA